jgi:hypothetical protein
MKITGGSFGGEVSMDTANRLVNSHKYTVVVKASGTPVFVDCEGREVTLYFTIDADKTAKGIEALKQWRQEQFRREEEARERSECETEEIDSLMSGLTHEEIVSRLKGGAA